MMYHFSNNNNQALRLLAMFLVCLPVIAAINRNEVLVQTDKVNIVVSVGNVH